MKVNGFDNTLDKINLTYQDIEKQILTYDLTFSKIRRNDVEWNMSFPMFVPPFYKFVIDSNKIPTQSEYWQFYLSNNSAFFRNSKMSRDQTDGLMARVYRTYPSLVRDLHFGKSLKSSNIFDEVFYNETIDIQYGVDVVVKKSDSLLGLNLYTNTQNALIARRAKEFRPKKHLDFNCIEIPISFRGSNNCGMFYLYSDRELKQIIGELLDYV